MPGWMCLIGTWAEVRQVGHKYGTASQDRIYLIDSAGHVRHRCRTGAAATDSSLRCCSPTGTAACGQRLTQETSKPQCCHTRLIGVLAGSFLAGVDARFLVFQPGAPTMLSTRRLVQRAEAVDFGGAGPYHRPLDGGVQVAGDPAAPDPGIEGDFGHGQVLGQVAQPPFVLGQRRAARAGMRSAGCPQPAAGR